MTNQINSVAVSRQGKYGPEVLHRNIERFGGIACVELIRKVGGKDTVLARQEVHNTVVNAGKKQVLRLAAGIQTKQFDVFRIGTSGAAVNSIQTDVLSPAMTTTDNPFRTSQTPSVVAGTRTLQLVISYPSGGTSVSVNSIQEVAILNSQVVASSPSCLMRATFTPVNKTQDDKLKITYSLRIT